MVFPCTSKPCRTATPDPPCSSAGAGAKAGASASKLAEGGTFQPSLFDERGLAEVASDDYPGERLVVCRNPLLAERRRRKREELLAATEAGFEPIAKEVARRTRTPLKAARIAEKAARVKSRFKVGKHFDADIADGSFSWTRRQGRSSYKLWEEPVPDFVLEDLSPGNWRCDAVDKRQLYRRLSVREYWMFDETAKRLRDDAGRRLGELLVGYWLRAGEYERVCANAAGRLPSKVLGLEMCVRDGLVRFYDAATGEYLATYSEAQARIAALEAELRARRAAD